MVLQLQLQLKLHRHQPLSAVLFCRLDAALAQDICRLLTGFAGLEQSCYLPRCVVTYSIVQVLQLHISSFTSF